MYQIRVSKLTKFSNLKYHQWWETESSCAGVAEFRRSYVKKFESINLIQFVSSILPEASQNFPFLRWTDPAQYSNDGLLSNHFHAISSSFHMPGLHILCQYFLIKRVHFITPEGMFISIKSIISSRRQYTCKSINTLFFNLVDILFVRNACITFIWQTLWATYGCISCTWLLPVSGSFKDIQSISARCKYRVADDRGIFTFLLEISWISFAACLQSILLPVCLIQSATIRTNCFICSGVRMDFLPILDFFFWFTAFISVVFWLISDSILNTSSGVACMYDIQME